MLSCDTTTRSLEIVLAGAVTTSELPWVSTYTLYTASGITPGASHGTSNGVTPVTVMPAPGAAQYRQLKWLSVRNADTVASDVIVRYVDGATVRQVWRLTLQVGDTLWYMDAAGLFVVDKDGLQKTTAGGTPITLPLAVAEGGTGSTTAADARTALGLSLPLAVGSGGTGSTTAANARTALGLAIGSDVQAWDPVLDDLSLLGDPNADRLLFWDDSAGHYAYLTAGTGLTISGTTLTASGAAPGGADGDVQYKSGSGFAGVSNFHWDGGNGRLIIGSGPPQIFLNGTLGNVYVQNATYAVDLVTGSYALKATGPIQTDQATTGVSTLGTVVARLPLYDTSGTLIGYVPFYDSIT